MKQPKRAGVWIDQSKAYLGFLDEQDEPGKLVCIQSEADGRHKPRGGDPHSGGAPANPDGRRRAQLRRFYADVLARLRGVDEVLVLGPGRARNDLARQAPKGERRRFVSIQRAGKLTKAQIAARIQRAFTDGPAAPGEQSDSGEEAA